MPIASTDIDCSLKNSGTAVDKRAKIAYNKERRRLYRWEVPRFDATLNLIVTMVIFNTTFGRYGTLDDFSDDLFLYNRCVAIVNGKEYYDEILNQSQRLNPDLEFESILYLPALAWAQKHHKLMDEYPHILEPSYESGSNTLLWE